MTDVSFTHDQYSIQHKRPRDGISSPNTVRVFNNAPRRVSLQIRSGKGYSTAIMTIEQLDSLIDTLIEARNDTYPPIEPRKT
jgi:hypothetical protein